MKREQVRVNLIEAAVSATNQSYRFNSGRITEFNSNRSNEYPYVWLESLIRNTEFNAIQMPVDEWVCVIHIAKLDVPGSPPETYESIVDECDLVAKRIIYNINQVINNYNIITLTGIISEPFIQQHADRTSGVILSFNLNIPDTTDVC